MAVTNIVPIHKGDTSIQTYMKKKIDYITDKGKTENQTLVNSYMCDPDMADLQFSVSKESYFRNTGRTQESDVIAYRLMQSFHAHEVTPQKANEIGYQLAEELTKGNHAFIVATHVNTDNVHNHIIWNSTNLKANRKWRNFYRTDREIAKVSDRLCLENGLSVIKKDDERKNTSYETWQENEGRRKINYKKTLKQTIDEVLEMKPKNLQEFLEEMKKRGYEVKQGKYLAFKKEGQTRFTRLRSLGDEYSEEAIIERIAKPIKVNILEQSGKNPKKDMSLMLDMEKIVAQEKGAGYERWAKKYNLRELAKTMSYLNENDLTDYEVLKGRTDAIKEKRAEIKNEIAERNEKLDEIKKLQTIIVDYSKTRTIYAEYKKTGFSEKFKNAHLEEIETHRKAKQFFETYEGSTHFASKTATLPPVLAMRGEFPKMQDLKMEYASILTEKKKLYQVLNELNAENKELLVAKENIDKLLKTESEGEQEQEQEEKQKARKKKQSQDR